LFHDKKFLKLRNSNSTQFHILKVNKRRNNTVIWNVADYDKANRHDNITYISDQYKYRELSQKEFT
jgi:hypothetical protein